MKQLEASKEIRKKVRWLEIASKAMNAGEKKALSFFTYQKTNGYSYKKHHEIVTNADLETNKTVIRVLKRLTPKIPILSEEGGTIKEKDLTKHELAWALDPIDGTTNFTARLPLWGISLALLHKGEPIVGVISLPMLKQRYHAVKDEGAFMGSNKLQVSKTKELNESLGLLCYGYLDKEITRGQKAIQSFSHRVRSLRVLGAAVIEAIWVASGRADFSILHGVHTWDVAAGALIVREAGGKALNVKGKNWKPGDEHIIFVNPALQKHVINAYPKR